MKIEEFRDELTKLGIKDSDDKANFVLSALFKTDDPILQEILNSADRSRFVSGYLKNMLKRIEIMPQNANNIIKSSSKMVEEIKAKSPIYIEKRKEIEEKKLVKANDNQKDIEKYLKEKEQEYENASESEKIKIDTESVMDVCGMGEKNAKSYSKALQLARKIRELKDEIKRNGKASKEKTKLLEQLEKDYKEDIEEFYNGLEEGSKLKTVLSHLKDEDGNITPERFELLGEIIRKIHELKDKGLGKDKIIKTLIEDNIDFKEYKDIIDELLNLDEKEIQQVEEFMGENESEVVDYVSAEQNHNELSNINSNDSLEEIIFFTEIVRKIYNYQKQNLDKKEIESNLLDSQSFDEYEKKVISYFLSLSGSELSKIYSNTLATEIEPTMLNESSEVEDRVVNSDIETFDFDGRDESVASDIDAFEFMDASDIWGALDGKFEELSDDQPQVTNEEMDEASQGRTEPMDTSAIDREQEGERQAQGIEGAKGQTTNAVEPEAIAGATSSIEDTSTGTVAQSGAMASTETIKSDSEKSAEQPTAMIVHKKTFMDKVKGFFQNIKNKGVMQSFTESFLSDSNSSYYKDEETPEKTATTQGNPKDETSNIQNMPNNTQNWLTQNPELTEATNKAAQAMRENGSVSAGTKTTEKPAKEKESESEELQF